jgi:hypothetical protein
MFAYLLLNWLNKEKQAPINLDKDKTLTASWRTWLIYLVLATERYIQIELFFLLEKFNEREQKG